ncbi:hypothetical protein [Nonomuraea phyllanthi]|uniref:hypothetical protein n=1 Tax=Nonomuraea phyllanthi TaxID=2219224 RepID=UPI0012933391|nr:hypothetical protein [Nonomuraea phyllanthi]
MFPEDWRPVKAVEVSGPQGGPVNAGPDPAIIQNIISRVAKAKAWRLEAEGGVGAEL